mmetsp:Transcript_60686/g.107758  ORF Transcript_60686/g.107758 Transcript_60686/m.107758 type:complete len:230 (-) Transcript_60686:5741-6430(-)
MYLLACRCGSISNGQRLAVAMMMPFSTERLSFGRPQTDHCWMTTGLPSTFTRVAASLWVSFSLSSDSSHSFSNPARYSPANGPAYPTMPAATSESPGSSSYSTVRSATVVVHRSFSPPRPSMSLLALESLITHISISWVSWSCLATAPLKSDSNCASLSSTALSSACAALSLVMVISKLASASFSILRFGSTAFATKWYLCIARVHMQRASHATDDFLMATGSKSSRST